MNFIHKNMSFDLEKYVKDHCDKKFTKKKFIKNITPIPVTEKIIGYP